MTKRHWLTAAFLLAGFVSPPRALGEDRPQPDSRPRWSFGMALGRTSLETPFVTPAFGCFKPCLMPDIHRGTTFSFSIARRLLGPATAEASVSPFLNKSTRLFFCGSSVSGPKCSEFDMVSRWLEYRLALEAHGKRSVSPFAGFAVGDAGYPGFNPDQREHRMFWDVRAGIEGGRRIGGRLEVSRTKHLNPPWEPGFPDEGFVDWQLKAGIRLNLY